MGVFQTVFQIVHMWELFVSDFGKFLGFITFHKYGWYPVINVATALPVQLFYLDRAYRLWHKSFWIPVLLIPCILGSIAGGIGSTVQFSNQGLNPDYTTATRWFYGWDACTLAVEIGLTSIILVGLARAKTGWSHTDYTLSRLIKISAEAQMVPALMALAILITVLVSPQSSVIFFWFQTLGKGYIVAMLAVLNFRISVGSERTSLQSSKVNTHTPRGSRPLSDTGLVRDYHEMGDLHRSAEAV